MNRILMICTAASLVVGLSACDQLGIGGRRGGDNVVAANNAATTSPDLNSAGGKDPAAGGNSVASTAPTAAPADGRVTTAFLLGRWTDTGDCNNTVEFRDDGSFVTSQGARGIWALNGDQLTFQGDQAITATVSAPSAGTIVLTHADGTVGRSTRCTGNSPSL